MIDKIYDAIKNEDDELIIKLAIELYLNYDLSNGYDQIGYDLFNYTITAFEQGKMEKFLFLSEAISRLVKKINTRDSIRLYYEITTATYYVLGDTTQTITLLKEYVDFCKSNDFDYVLEYTLGNIATIQLDLKDYAGASQSLDDVKLYTQGDFSVAYIVDLARLRLEQNITEGVLDYLNEAYVRPELSDNYPNKIEVNLLFATYYSLCNQIDKANEWYMKTIGLIEMHELSYEQRSVYKRLAKVMALQNRYEESNDYLNKYIKLVESVIKKERELMATKAKLQVYINEKEHENILLRETNKTVTHASNHDFLTDAYNRRYFTNYIETLINADKNFSMLLMDIDSFKEINDTYGHQIGDFILRELCRLTEEFLDDNHMLARIAGDEFVVTFNFLDHKDALILADKLKNHIQNHIFKYDNYKIKITISGGIAKYEIGLTVDNMLKQVDAKLYRSKDRGKNAIT
ncbi:diguanylate cyclase [Acidaminobacter sp. JC074]|uniref:tetratricopeptide repeat-containing diguanylate cyclase n=1 Tax=Acidaminobacter sp. JC074 TaxID=2530199 RepID=UPI001F0F2DE5|nr:diguanylate cyclase [Acidaminobacter sp. JC074]MCH4889745.1 diguanylate cyclase [Acidaminobacter sp. JC074]